MTSVADTTGLSAMWRVCRECEHSVQQGRRLCCSKISGAPAIGDLVGKREFCPVGKHTGIALTIVPGMVRASRRGWTMRLAGLRATLLRGAGGLLTWVLRRCAAPANVVRWRRSQCRSCERRVVTLGVISTCGVCKCLIRAKTAIAAQRCPLKSPRWGAIEIEKCRPLPLKKCGGCQHG